MHTYVPFNFKFLCIEEEAENPETNISKYGQIKLSAWGKLENISSILGEPNHFASSE